MSKMPTLAGKPFSSFPFLVQQSPGPHEVIVLLLGQAEKSRIVDDSADLLKELCSYRRFL